MALPEIIKDIDARVIRPTSTDNAIVRFNGTTGQIQNTANIIDDNNNVIFQKVINSGSICINGRNFNNEIINSTTGGTLFGVEYDDINHLPENGIVQIRGEGGSFGLASHCSYTDETSEKIIGKRCFYKNAENNYCKNNNYALTPTALILKNDGHLKYYIGNTKVYSKNEEVIMNEYEVLHTGNIGLVDSRFVKKSGDTMTGTLKFSGSNGIQTRHIDGESTTFGGDLYLNYGVNAPIHVGQGGSYYISTDGSYYNGTSQYTYDIYPLINNIIYTTSTGWYRIAYYSQASDTPRSKVNFIIQGVGGSVSPSTTEITFLLNWGSLGCNEIIINGDRTYIQGARITKDSNYTYLEVYIGSVISSNGSCYLRVPRNFNNSLSNASFNWYVGSLPTSVATSVGLSLSHITSGLSQTSNINIAGSLYPVNPTSYQLGNATYEWGESFIRQQYSRHIDASKNYTGDKSLYIGYNWCDQVLFYTNNGSTRTYCGKVSNGGIYGAVWNDYAEYRESDITQPGRCIIENGDDTLRLSTERLQRGAEIVSDTFGFAIGETDDCKTPIAASGRVLAYPFEDREEFKSHIGYPVCSGPNGTVSIMTDEEEQLYPSRIIGYVSAVPDYEIWGTGNVKVDGRIWIRIK